MTEEDVVEYSPKSDFSKGLIVLEAVRACVIARGKEMKAGYENITSDKHGNTIRVKIPDTRKAFISTVDALKGLLAPECKRDKKFEELWEKHEEEVEKIFDEFAYTEEVKDSEGRWVEKENAITYVPEPDAVLPGNSISKPLSSAMEPIQGLWDNKVNLYWNEMVELYDELFSELNMIVDRLNYFKSKAGF